MTDKLNPATVRALLDRATKGPWIYEYTRIGHTVRQPGALMNAIFVCNRAESPENDAALIASAPALAAAYLEALAVIEGLMDAADDRRDWLSEVKAARAFLAKHKE